MIVMSCKVIQQGNASYDPPKSVRDEIKTQTQLPPDEAKKQKTTATGLVATGNCDINIGSWTSQELKLVQVVMGKELGRIWSYKL